MCFKASEAFLKLAVSPGRASRFYPIFLKLANVLECVAASSDEIASAA